MTDRSTITTYILIGILVGIFVLCEFFPSIKVFIFGYFTFWGVGVLDGQVWRLLSGAFLHSNIPHLLFNCLFLWQIFPWTAHNFGLKKAHIILWTSVMGGAILSAIGDTSQPGVGISGGLFGLFGLYILSLWTLKKYNQTSQVKSALNSALLMLALNLYLGLTLPDISNLGHIGGFITGLIVGKIYLKSMFVRKR